MAAMAEERVESQGFYEMLWDCEFCETKGLLAKSQRHCANCGGKQNPDRRYFPKPGEEQRLDGHKFVGSDRFCPACKSPQSAAATMCTNCGSPMDGSAEVKGVATPVAPTPKTNWKLVIGVIALIVGVIFFLWYMFFRTKEVKLTVTEHRWERAIGIDEYNDRNDSAWREQVPSDARMVTCHRAERSSKQVPDGETCTMENVDKKDGTFEKVQKCRTKYRSEPVYDDKCNFTVTRWGEVTAVRLTGLGMSPQWPTQGVPPAQVAETLGAKRAGRRTEKLILEFGKQTCEVGDAVWRKYKDRESYKVEVRARSGDIVCKSL